MEVEMNKTGLYGTVLLSLLFFSCWKSGVSDTKKIEISEERKKITAPDLETDKNGLSLTEATLKTVHGDIVFRFYPQHAPQTVARIIELIQQEFYNGLTFHRVVPNFVIQGGDPDGTGMGGSGQKLKAEFNELQHIKGTVAMARAQDPDSADSQFYIALATLPHLDRNYTIFGQVIRGLDILTKVSQGDKILSLTLASSKQ